MSAPRVIVMQTVMSHVSYTAIGDKMMGQITGLLSKLGIEYDVMDAAAASALADESIYDGAIVVADRPANLAAADKTFLTTYHTWAGGGHLTGVLAAAAAMANTAGMSTGVDLDGGNSTRVLDPIYMAGRSQPVAYAYGYFTHALSATRYEFTPLLTSARWNTGATTYDAWISRTGNGGGGYNFYYLNTIGGGVTSDIFGTIWGVLYYLQLAGITAPKPLTVHFDLDDINQCPPSNCLDDVLDWLADNDATMLGGWNPAAPGTWTNNMPTADKAKIGSDTRIPVMMHSHLDEEDIYEANTNTMTLAEIAAKYLEYKATSEGQLGKPLIDNLNGYGYYPTNMLHPRAMVYQHGLGLRRVRALDHSTDALGSPSGSIHHGQHSYPLIIGDEIVDDPWCVREVDCGWSIYRTRAASDGATAPQNCEVLAALDTPVPQGKVWHMMWYVAMRLLTHGKTAIMLHGNTLIKEHSGWIAWNRIWNGGAVNVSDGDCITIGDVTYEFDTNSTVTEGNVAIDVSASAAVQDAAGLLWIELIGRADLAVDDLYENADLDSIGGVLGPAIAFSTVDGSDMTVTATNGGNAITGRVFCESVRERKLLYEMLEGWFGGLKALAGDNLVFGEI